MDGMCLITTLMINNTNYYLPAVHVRIIRTRKPQYLMNKNYSTLTSINILKNSLTNAWCWVIALKDQRNISNVYTKKKRKQKTKKQELPGTCNTNQNVYIDSPASCGGEGKCRKYVRVETESGGTRRRTGGEVKGKEANGVGSQAGFSLTRNSPSSVTTIILAWPALQESQYSTELTPPPI